MTNESNMRGYVQVPLGWELLDTGNIGPFTTQASFRLEDGSVRVWSSRRHRKGYGSEVVASDGDTKQKQGRPSLFLWAPKELNWWIAVLFMIGSFGFILGSVLFLSDYENYQIINLMFFGGSVFFTAAGYSQYNQAINARSTIEPKAEPGKRTWVALQPARIDFWVTCTQFIGTIMFNFSTFDAFLNLRWYGQDLLIWVPDMVGSIFFQVSGALALVEICRSWRCWQERGLAWWITVINFTGCVAFMISALLAFIRPNPIFEDLATWATVFTLIGAVCFFAGAYLMWPEMSQEEGA